MFDKNESGFVSVRAVLTANYGLCGETADEVVSSLRASIQRAVSDGLLQGHSTVSSVESWEVSVGTEIPRIHPAGEAEGWAEPPSPEAGQVRRWTVWVVEKQRDHGTTFVTSCEAETAEAAGELAIEEAAESFGQPASELRVLGVAAGEVNLVIWDDDN